MPPGLSHCETLSKEPKMMVSCRGSHSIFALPPQALSVTVNYFTDLLAHGTCADPLPEAALAGESWILSEMEQVTQQVFPSCGFSGMTLSKNSYDLKKKFHFSEKMHWLLDQCLWKWTDGNDALFSGYLLFYITTYLSSQRWMALSRQVQNVPSRPKKLPVSLALIIIAQAHVSALHTFKDSLRINFQNGIAWEKQTDRSRQLYMCNVYHKKEF